MQSLSVAARTLNHVYHRAQDRVFASTNTLEAHSCMLPVLYMRDTLTNALLESNQGAGA
jgi:hypothetical protein